MDTNVRRLLVAFTVALVLCGVASAQEVKAPETAEDHLALAKQYDEKATMWNDEAAYHRSMATNYKRFSKSPGSATIARMEKHCMAIVKEAEKLATEAAEMAKDHRLRAKELEAKK